MKKLLLLLLLPGCTTAYQPIAIIPKPIEAGKLSQTLSQSQIQASQLNQYVSGLYGPNTVSQTLLDYQNANRNLRTVLQNPWDGIFILRNLWLP